MRTFQVYAEKYKCRGGGSQGSQVVIARPQKAAPGSAKALQYYKYLQIPGLWMCIVHDSDQILFRDTTLFVVYLVRGTLFVVPCSWYLVRGTLIVVPCLWHLVPCLWYLDRGSSILAPCSWHIAHCTLSWYLDCVTWFVVP